MSAVAHNKTPDRAARGLTQWLDPDVRTLVERLDLPHRRERVYLDQLDMGRPPRPQLGQTLAMLRAVVTALDDDKTHEHYTRLLTGQAQRLEAQHLNGRR